MRPTYGFLRGRRCHLFCEIRRKAFPAGPVEILGNNGNPGGAPLVFFKVNGGPPHPLPESEELLLHIADRVLDIFELRHVVRDLASQERESRVVAKELYSRGVDSVSALASTRLFLDGMSESSVALLKKLEKVAKLRAEEGPAERIDRYSEVLSFGGSPLLMTAPHNLFLRRDGEKPHMREDFTSFIAQEMARHLEGKAICWTKPTQWRTETRYAVGVSRRESVGKCAVSEALDETIRDPNYLHENELGANAWFRSLRASVQSQASVSRDGFALHIDVHGCQGPPVHPAHMIIGLGAMRQRALELPTDDPMRSVALNRLALFADSLRRWIGLRLASFLELQAFDIALVTGTATTNRADPDDDLLKGACPKLSGRRTLTQQSVLHAGVTHAMQLEISYYLRDELNKHPQKISSLAKALRACWEEAVAKEREGFSATSSNTAGGQYLVPIRVS